MKVVLISSVLLTVLPAMRVESAEPYYREIPGAPVGYTGPNVAARLVDGLGFRYYWATEGLRAEDLAWSPDGDKRRSTADTIDHIYALVLITLNATRREPTSFPVSTEGLSFAEKREATLANLKAASDNLRGATEEDLESFRMVFRSPDGRTVDYPFWNDINGPIADALWHCGQIVSFRRSSGNPLNPNISLLEGRVRE